MLEKKKPRRFKRKLRFHPITRKTTKYIYAKDEYSIRSLYGVHPNAPMNFEVNCYAADCVNIY